MALDAAMLRVTALELQRALEGARVDKLYMPARDEALLLMRTPEGQKKLLISTRPGSARIHITSAELEYPAVPPAFCMLLRKHLLGGRLREIACADSERVMFLTFDTINELGDRTSIRLSVELMGRYSNLVIIGADGRVIDALKRIDDEMSPLRQLLPGVPFTLPPAQEGRLPLFSTPAWEIAAAAARLSKPLSSALLSTVAGAGPALCREMAARCCPGDPEADTLSPEQLAGLADCIAAVTAAADRGGELFNIVYDGEKPVEFSFLPLTQYGGLRREEFATAGELFDCYYGQRDLEERKKARSHDLKRQVNTLLERARRRQQSRTAELGDSGKAAERKLFGELLTAYPGSARRGDKSVQLLNYYTGEQLEIPLDPRLDQNANAQRYFKEYRKLTTAKKMLEKLVAEGAQEIEYLSSVLYEIDSAKSEEDFIWIRRELREAGYLKAYRLPQGRVKKPEQVITYRSSEGCKILVGRNNAANDRLTLKTADRFDIWFHVKDAPGSHVVLCCEGGTPGDQSLTEAAVLAATHSSLSGGGMVAVDYTQVRNVKKAPGAKAGMVLYVNYHTAFVKPDPALAAALRESKPERTV